MPELSQIAEKIAPVLKLMLSQYDALDTPMRRYYNDAIDWMLREIPVVPTKASIAAIAAAASLGKTSLLGVTYAQQGKFDRGRKSLHWEHVVPISDLRAALLALVSPTDDDIKTLLMKYQIAWVTKEENQRLKRNRRDDPDYEYASKGINLIDLAGG